MEPSNFYAACNLKSNPFQSNPVQEMDPRMGIWVGYETEKTTFEKFLVRTRANQVGNTNLLMLYGELGTGKSHALLWARHIILDKEKDTFNSVAYYIQTLIKDQGKLSFAGAFKYDIVEKSNLISDTRDYKQFIDQCVIKYIEINKLGHISKNEVIEKLIPSSEFNSLAKEIAQCETAEAVKDLLLSIGLNDYQAMQSFARLMNLFLFEIKINSEVRRFKNACYLFIDELDLLAECSPKEAREANALFRHLYDLIPRAFCMVLAFTATAAELNVLFADFVLSRVSKQIKFDFLDTDEAKLFIQAILDSDRVNNKKHTGYFPFDESAISTIVEQLVSITPRDIVRTMQQILEEIRLNEFDFTKGLITSEYLESSEIIDNVIGSD